jgi:hypothetical protein
MALNVPELEQRLSNLQSQVENLWHRTERNVPLEERLSGMADEYAGHLKRWANTVERHTRAITQLEAYIGEFKAAGSQIQEDSSQRLEELEAVIDREWAALKSIHEEPAKELREQAANLTAICLATASAAQQGLERAESRLAAFEGDFRNALTEITRELRTVVAEIKTRQEYPPGGVHVPAQWAFDDVARLHGHLRDSETIVHSTDASLEARGGPGVKDPRPLLPMIAGDVQGDRVAAQAHPPLSGDEDRRFAAAPAGSDRLISRNWRIAVVCLAVAVVVISAFGWRLYGEFRSGAQRVQDAELESARATRLAVTQAAAAREEAAREIASARELATRAQTTGNVLAAPDLVRYNLVGTSAAPRASGQALWSRSRGLVFSGAGIPPAPPNGHHQLWLLTRVAPVKAGTVVLEADGTVTSVQRAPFVPRAVIGVVLTIEGAAGGGEAPSGNTVLTSIQAAE